VAFAVRVDNGEVALDAEQLRSLAVDEDKAAA